MREEVLSSSMWPSLCPLCLRIFHIVLNESQHERNISKVKVVFVVAMPCPCCVTPSFCRSCVTIHLVSVVYSDLQWLSSHPANKGSPVTSLILRPSCCSYSPHSFISTLQGVCVSIQDGELRGCLGLPSNFLARDSGRMIHSRPHSVWSLFMVCVNVYCTFTYRRQIVAVVFPLPWNHNHSQWKNVYMQIIWIHLVMW